MNAQSVWIGEIYAYTTYRPERMLPMDCKRVRILDKYTQTPDGAKKAQTFVYIEYQTEDGSPTGFTERVNVNRIVDFWDQYKAARDSILRKQDEERLERERIRAAAEAERMAEAQKRQQQQEDTLNALAQTYNIPRHKLSWYSPRRALIDID